MTDELNFDPSSGRAKPPEGYRRAVGVLLGCASISELNRFGMKSTNVPVVRRVIPDSPADIAGLITGDMILDLDGTPISALPGSDTDQVTAMIQQMSQSVANVIVLRIRRNQEEFVLKICL